MASNSTRSARASASRRPRPAGVALSPGGIVAAVAALAVAGGLSWLAVTHNLADEALRTGHADQAYRLNPYSAAVAAKYAETRLDGSRSESAIRISRQAVLDSPISIAGLRNWGFAAQMKGDLALSSRLMGQAAAMGWRDAPTQLWLIAAAMQAHAYGDAMRYVDAISRTMWLVPRVQYMLDGIAASPDGAPHFAALLAKRPLWREHYFTPEPEIEPERVLLRATMLRRLVGTAAPPTAGEVRAIVDALTRTRQYVPAFALWQAATGLPAGVLVDPGFDHAQVGDPKAAPFEWRVQPLAGAEVNFDGEGKARALHVASDGSASGPVTQQIVLLAPGSHRVSVAIRTATPGAADAYRLAVSCLGPGGRSFRSPPPRGAITSMTLDFEVSADGSCDAQSIAIVVQHSEASARAEAWFDDTALS